MKEVGITTRAESASGAKQSHVLRKAAEIEPILPLL